MPFTSYNFRKGIDVPNWEWLNQSQNTSQVGCGVTSDGVRYIYFAIQSGTTTAGQASTTQLWRYDCWTNGWQFLAGLTNSNQGIDIDLDPIRNVIWIIEGNATTAWRYFNLNATQITLAGLTTNAWSLSSAIATVLPANAAAGSSVLLPNDVELAATFDSGIAKTGSTTTSLIDDTTDPGFNAAMIGHYLEYTSGALAGNRRCITAINSASQLTTVAFGSAPAAGDSWQVVLPRETATSATSTTIARTGAGWPTNRYANADVEIVSGTGVGQRRRIASNDATTLTLSGLVTGNPRTGPWATTPDATSVFVIKTSSDFLYFQPGGSTALHRVDVVASTLSFSSLTAMPAATGSGGDLKHAKGLSAFSLIQVRGANANNIYIHDIGANSWGNLTHFPGPETFNTGATTLNIPGRRRMLAFISARLTAYVINIATGIWEPAPSLPFSAPGGVDGKRCAYIKTPDGAEFVYFLRASGQEFFRIPLEWL